MTRRERFSELLDGMRLAVISVGNADARARLEAHLRALERTAAEACFENEFMREDNERLRRMNGWLLRIVKPIVELRAHNDDSHENAQRCMKAVADALHEYASADCRNTIGDRVPDKQAHARKKTSGRILLWLCEVALVAFAGLSAFASYVYISEGSYARWLAAVVCCILSLLFARDIWNDLKN